MVFLGTLLALVVFARVQGFAPSVRGRSKLLLRNAISEFEVLEKKLLSKVQATGSGDQKKIQQREYSTNAVTVERAAKIPEAPLKPQPLAIAKRVSNAPTSTKIVESVKPQNALSGGEVALGIFLGTVPYLLLPIAAAAALKGVLKKPKPLPKEPVVIPKVQPYSKPLKVGAKEGINDLLSGKRSPDLDLTRKGIKFSAAGLGVAAVLTGVLIVTQKVTPGPVVVTASTQSSKVVTKAAVPKSAIRGSAGSSVSTTNKGNVPVSTVVAPIAPVIEAVAASSQATTAPATPAPPASTTTVPAPAVATPTVVAQIGGASSKANDRATAPSDQAVSTITKQDDQASQDKSSRKTTPSAPATTTAVAPEADSAKNTKEAVQISKPDVVAQEQAQLDVVKPSTAQSVKKGMQPDLIDVAAFNRKFKK